MTPSMDEEVEVKTEFRAELVDDIDRPFNLAIAHDILGTDTHILDLDQLIYDFHAANDRARRQARFVPPSLLRSETMLGDGSTRAMVGPVSRSVPHLVRSETMLGDEATQTTAISAVETIPGAEEELNIEIEPGIDFESEDLTRPVRSPIFRAPTPFSGVGDYSQSQEILRAQPGWELLCDMTTDHDCESVSSEDSDTCVLPPLGRRVEALRIDDRLESTRHAPHIRRS